MGVIIDFFKRILGLQPRLQKGTPNQVLIESDINQYLAEQFDYEALRRYEDINSYNDQCKRFFNENPNAYLQYDYRQLVQYMEQCGAMEDFFAYYDYIMENTALFFPSKVHGIEHTSRVTFFAEMLTTLDNIDPHLKNLIMNAAVLHDIGRENDEKDPNHGKKSVDLIDYYQLLDTINPRDKRIICFAVACHSMHSNEIAEALENVSPGDRADCRIVLDYLQDADKLDRVRVANKGWGLDPFRLATNTAKSLVKVAHQNYSNFDRIIYYERQKDKIKAEIDLKNKCYYELRKKGITIPYRDFESIIGEYNPGTLEILDRENRLGDILSYKTFQEYGKSENVFASNRVVDGKPDLSFKGIFEDAKKSVITEPLETTVKSNYMLIYNLKKNHSDSYSLYLMCDSDMSDERKIGILSILTMQDINAIRDAGFPYRVSDIVELSRDIPIEELRRILDENNFSKLASADYVVHPNVDRLKEKLRKLNISVDDDYLYTNYKYLDFIVNCFPDVLTSREFREYTLPEIYAACTRVDSAENRLMCDERLGEEDNLGERIPHDSASVLKYLKFFKKVNAKEFLNDDRQFDIIAEVGHETEVLSYPSYIRYATKANKPYEAGTLKEKIIYKRFCIKKILEDKTLTLDQAKEKLMLALFDFDAPEKYLESFEKAFLISLHYHEKYFKDSEFEQENSELFGRLREILGSKSKEEFEELLEKSDINFDSYNLEALQRTIKSRLRSLFKQDVIHELQDTARIIDRKEFENIRTADGTIVKAKVLRGEPFTIATTTLIPICSSRSKDRKTRKWRSQEEIRDEILNHKINPYNKCATISTDYMISRAAAVGNECELVYGFVPSSSGQIGVSANYDLSTTKVLTKNNIEKRLSKKSSLYLKVEDYISTQIESHGETVINDYPRYIFCYDEINSLAIEKKKQLDAVYSEKKIYPPVELVLIPAKDIYIPRIKASIRKEHEYILEKCREGSLSIEDLDELITNPEGNVVTRTIQAANSVTIKKDILIQEDFISEIFSSLTMVLKEVAKNVPPDKMEDFKNAVQLLIDRGDSNTEIGKKYFNYNYAFKIPIQELRELIGEEPPKRETNIHSSQREDGDYSL